MRCATPRFTAQALIQLVVWFSEDRVERMAEEVERMKREPFPPMIVRKKP